MLCKVVVLIFIIFISTLDLKAYTWQKELVDLSITIRENELRLIELEGYKELLSIKRQQNLDKLKLARQNIANNILALYKMSLTPIKMFIIGEKSNIDIAITYSLFTYYINYFNQQFVDSSEYLKIIAITESKYNKIEKDINYINSNLRKNYDLLKVYLKDNNKAQIANVKANNNNLIKNVDSLVTLMGILNKSYLLPAEEEADAKFISNKGNFVLPVVGFMESEYKKLAPSSIYYNGIQILASPSSQIVAPFDGEVVFSDVFYGFDTLIILKHSPSYFSVISGKYTNFVKVTQLVKKHEPIGISIDKITPIYLEVQYKEIPIDPLGFIKNKK